MKFIDRLKFTLGFGGNSFFNSQNSYLLGYSGAVWIDTAKPRELYETIPQLYTTVNKLAAMFSNAEIKVVDDNGNDIGTDEFYTLMQNPNFAQSMNEWLSTYLIQKVVYGNTFMYKNIASSLQRMPSALWNLSPAYTSPIFTGKTFDQVEMAGVIKGYRYCEKGKEHTYEPQYILYTKITDIDNPFIGQSPLMSLRFPLTNTKLAYEYRNVIMGKRGAIGMLSPEQASGSNAIPLMPDERQRITNQHLSNYGIGEGQTPLLISEASLKWQPMTYPTKDLMLFEEIDANFMTILDTLGINRNIFKDSTFENQKSGLIQTYQDTVIPQADQLAQDLTKFLGIEKGKIVFSYDHLSIMQTDKDKEAATLQKQVASIVQLYEKNIINKIGAVQMLVSVSGINIEEPTEDTIDILNRMSPLVANNVIQQLLINEIRALVGQGGITEGNQRPIAANAEFNQQPQF
jgi:phage portal protein BeeE